jgi:hypothetical protein
MITLVRGRVLCVTRTAATNRDETQPKTTGKRHGQDTRREEVVRGIRGTGYASRWDQEKRQRQTAL